MRILEISPKARQVKVLIEYEEDLWTLRMVLRPGDLVEGWTTRDVAGKAGSVKERRAMILKIKVGNVEFQPFTGKLRVFGVIVEGPEEYGVRGKHHSMYLTVGDVITLEREEGWSDRVLEKFKSSGPRGKALIIAVDYDEYAIALVANHGFKILVEESSHIPGKDDPRREEAIERYVDRVSRTVLETMESDISIVVVVGPGYLKNMVADKIKALNPMVKVYTDDTSMGGVTGLREALRRPSTLEYLREFSIVEAESVLEEFMSLVAREPERVAYGLRDVKAVALMKAIRHVVVLDSMLSSPEDSVREDVELILARAEDVKAKVTIVPRESPPGERVERLGGVIAILRYPIPLNARQL